jgi:anti-sigma factor RsiW
MSACNHIGPLLDGYYDGELGSLERWRVQRHLARCGACRHDLASLEAVGGCVRAAVAGQVEPDFWDGIAGRLPAPRAVERTRAPRRRRAWPASLATAAAAAAAAGVLWSGVGTSTDAPASGVVRSIYAQERPVMVLEADRSGAPTIIWLMDGGVEPAAKEAIRVGI